MEETLFLGLTAGQLLTLAGLGVILLIVLFILGRALKLTKTLIKVGCMVILVLVVIVFVALRATGG